MRGAASPGEAMLGAAGFGDAGPGKEKGQPNRCPFACQYPLGPRPTMTFVRQGGDIRHFSGRVRSDRIRAVK